MQRVGAVPDRSTGRRRVLVAMRWPVGGIRTYILYNYPSLARAGYCFTFVGPAIGTFQAFRAELQDWDHVEFVEAPLRGRRCAIWKTVGSLMRRGGFALLHSHGLGAAAQVALANLAAGVPHVATCHDVFRPDQFPGLTGRAKLWGMGRLLSRVDALISVSQDAQANLFEYLPGLERTASRQVRINNGVTTHRYGDDFDSSDELRQRLGIGPDVFLMGFLGRFMQQKGFLPLLKALEGLATDETAAPFHVVAVGSGDYVREYRAEVERRGLSRWVTFLEFVTDVGPILRQLDLLVMPSLWEACPLLPMEALACGVPVLGSDCIGLREVLRGTPSRTFSAGDVEALRFALGDAITNSWTDAARAYAPEAKRRFDVAQSANQLRQVFDRLAAGP